jgi:type I restriction enzyme, S subunit
MQNLEIKNKSPEIFEVWSDKVVSRIDPFFYRPLFQDFFDLLQKNKFQKYSLKDIALIFSGHRPKGGVRNIEAGVPSLGGEHVLSSGEIKANELKFIPEEFHQKHLDTNIVAKDIILVKDGATTGKVGIIPDDYPYPDCNINEHVFAIRITDKKVIPEFVFSVLFSDIGQLQIKKNITGATVTGLTRESVENLLIPLPDLILQQKVVKKIQEAYEQKKKKQAEILKILSSIDDFVLGELGIDMPRGGAERVFQIWSDEIQTRLDPSYFRPIFKMLDKIFSTTKYNVKTLKNLSVKITSGATPLSGGDAYTDQDSGIPFVRSGNINPDNEIDFNSLLYIKPEIHNKKLKSSQLKKGDLMIAIVGATIGQVSVYENDREANINQAIALIRLDEQVNPEYAKEFLYSKIGQIQLDRIKRPVARANINLDEVGSLQVIYPSKDKQNEMVGKIRKIRAKATELRQEAESIVAGAQKEIEQMILSSKQKTETISL